MPKGIPNKRNFLVSYDTAGGRAGDLTLSFDTFPSRTALTSAILTALYESKSLAEGEGDTVIIRSLQEFKSQADHDAWTKT